MDEQGAVSYVAIYTPLKRVTWLNTLAGAIPGALPPLMGWTAARGELSGEGWALFAILAFWQIPHFMAIAWLYREDYAQAGFVMLPSAEDGGNRTLFDVSERIETEAEADLVRGLGAVEDNALVWASPFGWAQRMDAFGDERWWPIPREELAASRASYLWTDDFSNILDAM